MTTLIATAAGKVGKHIASNMIAVGDKPRLYVRDPVKIKGIFPEGKYEVAEGDLYDAEAIRTAMEGVDAVFFPGLDSLAADLSYTDHIINAAVDAGAKRVVFLSAFMADSNSDSPFVKMMGTLEDKVKASGLGYTILGAEWFMDNFFGYVSGGELNMPFGKGQNSFIATDDIGAVAAEVLKGNEHVNRSYILTGPETLDHHQVVAMIAEVVGKPCSYNALTVEQFREKTEAGGWESWMTELYVDITKFMRDGMVAGTSSDVETILGRPPMSLREFVTKYKDQFSVLCETS